MWFGLRRCLLWIVLLGCCWCWFDGCLWFVVGDLLWCYYVGLVVGVIWC